MASCAGCQAHKLAALAAGVEPPRHLPGVLCCGNRLVHMSMTGKQLKHEVSEWYRIANGHGDYPEDKREHSGKGKTVRTQIEEVTGGLRIRGNQVRSV